MYFKIGDVLTLSNCPHPLASELDKKKLHSKLFWASHAFRNPCGFKVIFTLWLQMFSQIVTLTHFFLTQVFSNIQNALFLISVSGLHSVVWYSCNNSSLTFPTGAVMLFVFYFYALWKNIVIHYSACLSSVICKTFYYTDRFSKGENSGSIYFDQMWRSMLHRSQSIYLLAND